MIILAPRVVDKHGVVLMEKTGIRIEPCIGSKGNKTLA